MLKNLLLAGSLLLLHCTPGHAQCTILPMATTGPLTLTPAGTAPNPMAMVYNPNRQLYYCVFGGSTTYSVDIWNSLGTRLGSVAPLGYDYRGAWWNPTTGQVEGNGYNNESIVSKSLNVNGYPVATTITTIFATGNGLSLQNVGAYDPANNEIIYYSAGTIKRVSRATNATVATAAVTGLPTAFASLNPNVVLYIGCAGKEYGLYDATNKAVHFVSRATNTYVGTCQLPATASASTTFGISYTNNLLFLFNYTARIWSTYNLFSNTIMATTAPGTAPAKLTLLPNPARGQVQVAGATGPVRLLDMTGRVLREQATNTLLLNNLAAGLYVVQSGISTARLVVE
ncbi:MAG: T9SS type A sorting domain-containing protein [Hymenobacter sp.]|nr:MAG: T9SS type A sorting domain-containing protein [Hymenobacter sp.]